MRKVYVQNDQRTLVSQRLSDGIKVAVERGATLNQGRKRLDGLSGLWIGLMLVPCTTTFVCFNAILFW
jgi:hypothetical protein